MKLKEIEDARKEILRLKEGLKYFKNEGRKAQQISMINVFIRLVNVSEELLKGSIDKDVIDTMLLRMIEQEYEKAQYTDQEGFISNIDATVIRDLIAFDCNIGREGKKELLALKMAADMLYNSDSITPEEKELPIPGNERLSDMFIAATDFWKKNLDKILEYCHYKKGVWNS